MGAPWTAPTTVASLVVAHVLGPNEVDTRKLLQCVTHVCLGFPFLTPTNGGCNEKYVPMGKLLPHFK